MHLFNPVIALLVCNTFAFPSGRPELESGAFAHNALRSLEAIKNDPETVELIRSLYARQQQEKATFFKNHLGERDLAGCPFASSVIEEHQLEARKAKAKCLSHPLKDFLPTNITGLAKFPHPEYPYQDPLPTDQRGPCPGLNTLANHGYIPRNGIATLAETLIASAKVFNMGVDLTTFLAGGSVLLAGDIPSMRFSIGGADNRTNSGGKLGAALGTETGLSGHLRFKEGDASASRCDFYLCNGDNHNLNASVFLNLQKNAKKYGGKQYNVPALIHHFADQYNHSRATNPYFYFLPQQAALVIGATYFVAGFFSNGTIGAGGVANEASIASFHGAKFLSNGSLQYMPEQIPSQGWYRRGYPMFLSEGIDGIATPYAGAAKILKDPELFGANTGTPGDFNGAFSLAQFANSSNGVPSTQGIACAIEQAVYGEFISEFGTVVSAATKFFNTDVGLLGEEFSCPTPTGAPAVEADAPTFPGYPQPSPCTINRMQNGFDQCAPDTNTYDLFNSKSVPFCLNNPVVAAPLSNPYPVPGLV